jgi:hypothetical protein
MRLRALKHQKPAVRGPRLDARYRALAFITNKISVVGCYTDRPRFQHRLAAPDHNLKHTSPKSSLEILLQASNGRSFVYRRFDPLAIFQPINVETNAWVRRVEELHEPFAVAVFGVDGSQRHGVKLPRVLV